MSTYHRYARGKSLYMSQLFMQIIIYNYTQVYKSKIDFAILLKDHFNSDHM